MKKIFTLMTSLLLLGTLAHAQQQEEGLDETFVFVDADGNTVADGAVVTVSTVNDAGQLVVPLRVKNVSGQRAAVTMWEAIDQKPNGDWQTCAFGNCMILQETGYSPKCIAEEDYFSGIETEWIPEEEGYGSWSATLQIHVLNITTKTQFGRIVEEPGSEVIGYGPKVTVRFVYTDPAAITDSHAAAATPQAVYTPDGRLMPSPRKGLCIVRLSNGQTVKQLF